jgi:hypothetical protein
MTGDTPLDWEMAIARNRKSLLHIVAALFALAGVMEGKVPNVLPHHVYRAILRVLRPAESAVRRLIMIAARGLVLSPRKLRNAPVGIIPSAGPNTTRIPTFCLIDPLKRFAPSVEHADNSSFWVEEEDDDKEECTPFIRSLPRISVPGFFDPMFAPTPVPLPDGLFNGKHVGRRLLALKRALETLPSQARRLARWHARRDQMRQQFPFRPLRLSPFRPGLPPGYRQHPVHEIDQILRECHGLLRDSCEQPDTS